MGNQLKVVGAGVGRTGTRSLKTALETLLGNPCYHMIEVFERPQDVPHWHSAAIGNMPDWSLIFDGYSAAVDWPVGSFWYEISQTYPDSIILLSVRDPEEWWDSASHTIFGAIQHIGDSEERRQWKEMIFAIMANRFTMDLQDKAAAIEAFERHNDDVRKRAPKDRLVEWNPTDGWGPLCKALGVPEPSEPFPWLNDRQSFLAHVQAQTTASI